jgi:hypothetical protein
MEVEEAELLLLLLLEDVDGCRTVRETERRRLWMEDRGSSVGEGEARTSAMLCKCD